MAVVCSCRAGGSGKSVTVNLQSGLSLCLQPESVRNVYFWCLVVKRVQYCAGKLGDIVGRNQTLRITSLQGFCSTTAVKRYYGSARCQRFGYRAAKRLWLG